MDLTCVRGPSPGADVRRVRPPPPSCRHLRGAVRWSGSFRARCVVIIGRISARSVVIMPEFLSSSGMFQPTNARVGEEKEVSPPQRQRIPFLPMSPYLIGRWMGDRRAARCAGSEPEWASGHSQRHHGRADADWEGPSARPGLVRCGSPGPATSTTLRIAKAKRMSASASEDEINHARGREKLKHWLPHGVADDTGRSPAPSLGQFIWSVTSQPFGGKAGGQPADFRTGGQRDIRQSLHFPPSVWSSPGWPGGRVGH
jgi:hypothetical protein